MANHRRVILTAEGLIGVLAAGAVVVGIYAIANPNGIQFGSPLPVTAELASLVAAGITALALWFARYRREWASLVVGVAMCLLALMLLGFVAFALSFNQT